MFRYGNRRASSTGPHLRPIGIRTLLALSIGGLVLAATAAVLTIALFASARNTFELLGERTVLILDGIESEVRDKLQGASDVVAGVVQELETGRLRNASPQEIHDALSAIVATAPEVEVLLVWDGNLERRLAAREPDGTIVQAGPEPEDNARIRQMLENTPKGARVWGEPVAENGRAFINVAAQVEFGSLRRPLCRRRGIARPVLAIRGRGRPQLRRHRLHPLWRGPSAGASEARQRRYGRRRSRRRPDRGRARPGPPQSRQRRACRVHGSRPARGRGGAARRCRRLDLCGGLPPARRLRSEADRRRSVLSAHRDCRYAAPAEHVGHCGHRGHADRRSGRNPARRPDRPTGAKARSERLGSGPSRPRIRWNRRGGARSRRSTSRCARSTSCSTR